MNFEKAVPGYRIEVVDAYGEVLVSVAGFKTLNAAEEECITMRRNAWGSGISNSYRIRCDSNWN